MLVNREEKEGVISCLYKSSNILASDYNQETKKLTIIFNAGRSYTYSGIEHKDYIRFEIAESQGQIFSKHIRKYPTVKNPDINPNNLLNKVTQILTEGLENGTKKN